MRAPPRQHPPPQSGVEGATLHVVAQQTEALRPGGVTAAPQPGGATTSPQCGGSSGEGKLSQEEPKSSDVTLRLGGHVRPKYGQM